MKSLILIVFFIFLPGVSAGCIDSALQPISETRFLLSTVCTITLYDGSDSELLTQALDMCGEYEALFSMRVEGSDIWQINHAGGELVEVLPRTAEMIGAGLSYGENTGGMFDITIGRLSALWNFQGEYYIPGQDDIDKAQKTVDYRQVALTDDTVQISNPDTWLDMGGIAKGYIADNLAAFLVENGVGSALIDLGGDIVTIGQMPDGRTWRIGIREPLGRREGLFGIIRTGPAAIVTSGVYERAFESGGILYHHILDPATGYPAKTDVVSVTIVSLDAMTGDVLSTAALLAGSEGAEELLLGVTGFIGALLILEDGRYLTIGEIDFEANERELE